MGFFDKIFGKSSQSKFSHQKKTVLCPIDGKVIPMEQLPPATRCMLPLTAR